MKESENSQSQQFKNASSIKENNKTKKPTHIAFSLVVTCLSVVGGFRLIPKKSHKKNNNCTQLHPKDTSWLPIRKTLLKEHQSKKKVEPVKHWKTRKYSLFARQVLVRYCYFHQRCVLSRAAVFPPLTSPCSELVEFAASFHSERLPDLFSKSVFGRCVQPKGPLSEPLMWLSPATVCFCVCARICGKNKKRKKRRRKQHRGSSSPPTLLDESLLSPV